MRARLATLAALSLAFVARAQPAEPTVRPEEWPRAGQWPVPAWVVVLVGAALVGLVVLGLARAIRRRRR